MTLNFTVFIITLNQLKIDFGFVALRNHRNIDKATVIQLNCSHGSSFTLTQYTKYIIIKSSYLSVKVIVKVKRFITLFSDNVKLRFLCGADLLESFAIPGAWDPEDVSYIVCHVTF